MGTVGVSELALAVEEALQEVAQILLVRLSEFPVPANRLWFISGFCLLSTSATVAQTLLVRLAQLPVPSDGTPQKVLRTFT